MMDVILVCFFLIEIAARLDYFIVGVWNSTVDPVRGQYPLCNQYPYPSPCTARMGLLCNPNTNAGQIVIVQQPVTGYGLITICEVEVYEGTVRNS